jgi:hypothetical protein
MGIWGTGLKRKQMTDEMEREKWRKHEGWKRKTEGDGGCVRRGP